MRKPIGAIALMLFGAFSLSAMAENRTVTLSVCAARFRGGSKLHARPNA